jgi:hypothetical protein
VRQLKQRVSCVCRLRPLALDELKEYLHYRITRAGLATQSLFSAEVTQLIFEYTDGIPRLVNSLCDSALQTGFALRSTQVTPAILEEAAKDLELACKAPAEVEVPPAAEVTPQAAEAPAPTPARNGASYKGENGHRVSDAHVPFENFQSPQKSLSFFSSLMERWR